MADSDRATVLQFSVLVRSPGLEEGMSREGAIETVVEHELVAVRGTIFGRDSAFYRGESQINCRSWYYCRCK